MTGRARRKDPFRTAVQTAGVETVDGSPTELGIAVPIVGPTIPGVPWKGR